jgi:hypothetical protein
VNKDDNDDDNDSYHRNVVVVVYTSRMLKFGGSVSSIGIGMNLVWCNIQEKLQVHILHLVVA